MDTKSDEEADRLLEFLKSRQPSSDEYTKAVNNYKIFCETRNKKSSSIDKNVLITVAGNLAGILLILNYEKCNVLVSRALSFVGKR